MSRIGKKPIQIPSTVKVSVKDGMIIVKGENGNLERPIHPSVKLDISNDTINVISTLDESNTGAFQGLTRALIANMVTGVSKGFQRGLEINGIGYRAEVKENHILFNIGYSHPINFALPKGISAKIEKNLLTLAGIDKELLGHTAASIRRLRPPEPYKGKGIKYIEERIIRKAGKTGAA
ncbi:MAG: 50S ribosomal protein L6 [Proteobacteria bacterium]|nr:50S ribosomal protein L6 [Pseudomonadota bacterium]